MFCLVTRWVVGLSALLQSLNAEPIGDGDQLLLVQAIMRHGSRSPTNTFPNDPYQESFWPQGFGEQSAEGHKQQFELGRLVRKRYVKQIPLLSEHYNNRELYIRSTDFNRTIQSAQVHAAGLYADSGKKGVDYPDVDDWPRGYVPIPVHVIPTTLDPVAQPIAGCPRYSYLERLVSDTDEMKALDQESQELRSSLSQYMGAPLPLPRITTGTDSLNIEVANNLSVDPGVNELLPKANEFTVKRERIVNGLVYLQSNASFAIELAKVRGGPILWEVIERALAKQSCTDQCAVQSTCTCYPSKLKYYLYSTHYSILTGLVASLGFSTLDADSDTLPPDSSCFFFELWRAADGTYYIKVIYHRFGKLEDLTAKISGCTEKCSLQAFAQRSEPYRPLPNVASFCAKTNEL